MTQPQPDQPGKDDLDAQLNVLLEQIDKSKPEGAAPAAAAPAAPAPTDDVKEDPLGNDLANEIQQLLDDARKQPGEPEPAPAPAARMKPAAAPAPSAHSESPAPAAAPAQEPVNVAQIDQMLADDADDAVAGDFETINEVLSKEGDAPAGTPPAAAERRPPVSSAPPMLHGESATPPAEEQDDDLVDGGFESPQDLLAAQPAPPAPAEAGFTANAQSVARELDEQPETAAPTVPRARPSRTKPEKPAKANTRPRGGILSLIRHLLAAQLAQTPNGLRALCALLSRPVSNSPQMRDTIGQIGLITLFWGSVTIVGKVVSAFFMAGH